MSVNENIFSFVRDDYQRDNFDDFLKKVSFKYDVPSIHISGTNGKTVVASILNNVYKAANYKTGLFISSSSKRVEDMVFVNGSSVSSSQVEKIFNDNQKLFKKYDLSHFEIITFIALTIFKQENVDIAFIECGMGGEVDATNIFTPVLSIITSISMEHTNFLGKSISEIALQKAGIIKEDIPVLLGNIPEEALDVIANECKDRHSKIHRVSETYQPTLTNEGYEFDYLTHPNIKLSSNAYYSVNDACIAIDAIDILRPEFPVDEDKMLEGLKAVKMHCRYESLTKDPLTIIDGGHNPEAFENLAKSLQKAGYNKQIHVLLACFRDKNLIQMLSVIGAVADSITLATFDHPRAREESDYFLYLNDYKFYQDPIEAYHVLKEQFPEDIILITGSLAFAAYMLKRLNDEQ